VKIDYWYVNNFTKNRNTQEVLMSKHTSHDARKKDDADCTPNSGEIPAGQEAAEQDGSPAGEASGSAAGGNTAPKDATEQITALEAELAEAKDQFLRKAADFENFRKRMNREKQEAIDFANQTLLLDLILILDDFYRALQSVKNAASLNGEFESFFEGIAMIEKRLCSQLETKWGLKRFDSAGEAFDPNRHEAIMMEKSAETTEPLVKEDFLKGYTLKDRVVRAAKVKVLMPDGSAKSGDETDAGNANQAGGANLAANMARDADTGANQVGGGGQNGGANQTGGETGAAAGK
jgi:molecular chaperone GrpE